jgi:cyclopropane-fatty-acyl-phospholipid synthase
MESTCLVTRPPRGEASKANPAPRAGFYEQHAVKALARLRHGRIRAASMDRSYELGEPAQDGLTAEVHVHDVRFWKDLCCDGGIGAARSYIEGGWSTDDLTSLIRILCRNLSTLVELTSPARRILLSLARGALGLVSRDTRERCRRNISAHYDLGNEFFRLFLDPTLMYSSAIYAEDGQSLDEASLHKLDRICQGLELTPSDEVLEIGTGWGGLALHAAERYGCRITTTTISQEQHHLANERFAASPARDRIRLLSSDYRDLTGQFDKLASIEMIEAVGHKQLPAYFQACSRLLKPGGRLLVQAITMPDYRYADYVRSVDFIQRYIFPGGHLPSVGAMQAATAGTDLQLVSVDTFPDSYARTLREWRTRLATRHEEARRLGCDDAFLRTWEYYFCYCEAAFAERAISVGHFLWEKARH